MIFHISFVSANAMELQNNGEDDLSEQQLQVLQIISSSSKLKPNRDYIICIIANSLGRNTYKLRDQI